jgi:hypothetical protein
VQSSRSCTHVQNNCFGPTGQAYKIDYYSQHAQVVSLATWQSAGVLGALQANKQVMMSEFNTASCGGIPGWCPYMNRHRCAC